LGILPYSSPAGFGKFGCKSGKVEKEPGIYLTTSTFQVQEKVHGDLKGSLTRDFRLQVFFINHGPPGPQVFHWGRFEFFRKFAEIFANEYLSPVSLTPAKNWAWVSTVNSGLVSTVNLGLVSTVNLGLVSTVNLGLVSTVNSGLVIGQLCKFGTAGQHCKVGPGQYLIQKSILDNTVNRN
jgi:hypothetical protein